MAAEPLTRREWRDTRKLDRRALKLHAREIERRLKHLNGETQRAAAVAAVTVRKDVYDGDKKDQDRRIDELESKDDQRAGAIRLIGLLASGGAVSGVIALLWQAIKAIGHG